MNETPRSAPPSFVPTLTEVVRLDSVPAPMAMPAEFANLLDGWPTGLNTPQLHAEEPTSLHVAASAPAMVERILLRVELALANRLQETVDTLVEAHMRTLKLALRDQISAAVLEAVTQAVRQETEPPRPDSPHR